MMEIIPKGWFSWNFEVIQDDEYIADIDVSSWREKGQLRVLDQVGEVYRDGLVRGDFVFELNGAVLVRACKPSTWRRTLNIEHQGQTYSLEAKSMFSRGFVLLNQGQQVGSLTQKGWFSRSATIDLPQELPLSVRVFIVWLAVILWRRDAQAASG